METVMLKLSNFTA